jgi:hypothetical protein
MLNCPVCGTRYNGFFKNLNGIVCLVCNSYTVFDKDMKIQKVRGLGRRGRTKDFK